MEKYMAFMLGKHLVFLDSLQFMGSSLDKQVSNLLKEGFKYTSEIFKNEQFALMTQKVFILSYDYIDSFSKFDNKQLPEKTNFIVC